MEVERPEMKHKSSSQQVNLEPHREEQRDAQGQALGPRSAGTERRGVSATGLGCVIGLWRMNLFGRTVLCLTLPLMQFVLPLTLLGRTLPQSHSRDTGTACQPAAQSPIYCWCLLRVFKS